MLERLRKVVQEVNAADDLSEALDVIVRRVRQAMKTQVCSVYLLDELTKRYMLMATEGLNPDSVGKVSLSPSEGVVGRVVGRAEPINLEDASVHPAYHYVMETGEEQYHAFLGVPIIHQRKVLGVLVVQDASRRRFDQNEEAFLVTMSAQLAGVIAHAEVTGTIRLGPGSTKLRTDARFDGVAGAQGVGIGTAVVITPSADFDGIPDQKVTDTQAETARFIHALDEVREDIRAVGNTLSGHLSGEDQALFDVYLRMLDDNAIGGEVIKRIGEGNWAPGALREVILSHVQHFELMEDPYLRERASDIRDLGRRVLAKMQQDAETRNTHFPDNTILVAEEITPAMLGEVPTEKLVGLVSVLGSGNSHAAILARSMGIPTVMGVVDLPTTKIHGKPLILDGYSGRVFANATPELCQFYGNILAQEQQLSKDLESLRELPSVTLDGVEMSLWVNTGLPSDVALSLDRGAQGIGLYRTEVPFMIKEFFPSEAEQQASYRQQLEPFAPRMVTMRTLDIGGDKSLSYFPIEEENPSLGWRGVRVTLDHPEIFLVQVRAMMMASAGLHNLRILLPMVSTLQEVDESVTLVNQAFAELLEEGFDVQRPQVGVMIEVPAAVYQARALAKRVDFLSVGSNDLTQYLLAVDRNNPRVAPIYSAYHPAVLQALQHIVNEAHQESVQVSICGEMAGEPGGALLLMAMGYDVLSMNSTNLPRVKSVIRNVTMTQARSLLDEALALENPEQIQLAIKQKLKDWGVGHLAQVVLPAEYH